MKIFLRQEVVPKTETCRYSVFKESDYVLIPSMRMNGAVTSMRMACRLLEGRGEWGSGILSGFWWRKTRGEGKIVLDGCESTLGHLFLGHKYRKIRGIASSSLLLPVHWLWLTSQYFHAVQLQGPLDTGETRKFCGVIRVTCPQSPEDGPRFSKSGRSLPALQGIR